MENDVWLWWCIVLKGRPMYWWQYLRKRQLTTNDDDIIDIEECYYWRSCLWENTLHVFWEHVSMTDRRWLCTSVWRLEVTDGDDAVLASCYQSRLAYTCHCNNNDDANGMYDVLVTYDSSDWWSIWYLCVPLWRCDMMITLWL